MRWSRMDNRILEGLLGIGIVVTASFGLGAPLLQVLRHRAIHELEATLRTPVVVPSFTPSAAGLEVSAADRVHVSFPSPTSAQQFENVAGQLIVACTALVVLVLLLLVIRTLRRGQPFTRANALRVTAIGVAVALGGTLGPLVTDLGHNELLATSAPDSQFVTTGFTISFLWIAVGFIVIAMGEVLRQGVVLHAETEGLV
jgi:hypothetical protein